MCYSADMKVEHIIKNQWEYLLSFLPSKSVIESTAVKMGAMQRRREVKSAEDLLKLALAYGCTDLSLRGVAAWAQMHNVANISNVALLKRLRKAPDWLGRILGLKLASYATPPKEKLNGMRVRLVDATVISEPASKGTNWRVHLGYNLQHDAIDHIELTDVKGGETLTRFSIQPGEIVVGDRGYAHRRGLHSVIKTGGDFLVRLNWNTVPLQTCDGKKFDLFKSLQGLKDAEPGDFAVQSAPSKRDGIPPIKGRLIAIRKTAEATKAARLKIKRISSKKGQHTDKRTFETAEYVFLFTSVDSSQASAQALLDLYRFRWQIEIAFKRMKGLLNLGELPIKDPDLARTYLYAKLLAALILQDLTEVYLGFSPWGFNFP